MSDIQTVWKPELGQGDWSFNPTEILSESVTLQSPVLFGIGDGVTTQFQLRDGPTAVNQPVNPAIYRKDWQGNQLLYSTPRTNYIRNNTMQGAAVGIFPTNWSASAPAGITPSIVGTGTDGGINYVDVRFSGTASAFGTLRVYPETPTAIAAISGESWAFSPYCKIQSGSLSGINNSQLSIEEFNGVAYVRGTYAMFTPNSSSLASQRPSIAGTLSGGPTVNYIRPFIFMEVWSGAVIDVTLRIGMPQIEKGAVATSVIPTTNAAVTFTDYTIDANGKAILAVPPLSAAELTWLGTYIRSTVKEGGDLQDGNDLATAILISLFTDREALPDDVIPDGTSDRRGWIGDEGEDYKIGSRIWLLSRAKQTTETLNRAFDYIAEALQWLLDDDVVAKVDITVEWTRTGMLGSKVVAYQKDSTTMAMNFSWVWKGLN